MNKMLWWNQNQICQLLQGICYHNYKDIELSKNINITIQISIKLIILTWIRIKLINLILILWLIIHKELFEIKIKMKI